MNMRSATVDALSKYGDVGMRTHRIAAAIGKSTAATRNYLTRLEAIGVVERNPRYTTVNSVTWRIKPQPGPIQALREIAPEWSRFACFDYTGELLWQDALGYGQLWFIGDGRYRWAGIFEPNLSLTAINLRTQSVYLQQPDGTITEVTRAEWDV